MALPLVLSFTLRQAFGMVPLVYARFLGDASGVAAIGLFIPFQEVYIALWVGLSAGFTAALATAFGSRDAERVRRLKRTMLWVQGAIVRCSPVSVSGSGSSCRPWIWIPGWPRPSALYATTLLIGLPVTGFWSIYPDSIVKAHYDTRATMFAGMFATGVNVLLNTLFVFAFGWGIFGIALATVLSRLVALLYATVRANAHERSRMNDPAWREVTAERSWSPPLWSILALGLPASLTFVLTSLENSLINGLLTQARESTVALASYGVYYSLLRLAAMPAVAASVAVLPFVARMVPEGHARSVRTDLLRVAGMATGFGLLFTIPVGVLFPDQVAGFFLGDSSTDALANPADPERAARAPDCGPLHGSVPDDPPRLRGAGTTATWHPRVGRALRAPVVPVRARRSRPRDVARSPRPSWHRRRTRDGDGRCGRPHGRARRAHARGRREAIRRAAAADSMIRAAAPQAERSTGRIGSVADARLEPGRERSQREEAARRIESDPLEAQRHAAQGPASPGPASSRPRRHCGR